MLGIAQRGVGVGCKQHAVVELHRVAVNDAVRAALEAGASTVRLRNVNGQRYIGTGLAGAGVRIEVSGTPGQALAMFMDGPTVEVFGNAQDGVGNTMNSGTVIVHGGVGDVLGYGMRRGRIFVEGDVGYRAGIHMKADEAQSPVVVCGGKARDFFGEYMAGGVLVLLGMRSRVDGPIVGGHVGAGMHGGQIFVRGTVDDWCCGSEVKMSSATEDEKAGLRPALGRLLRHLRPLARRGPGRPVHAHRTGRLPSLRAPVHVPLTAAARFPCPSRGVCASVFVGTTACRASRATVLSGHWRPGGFFHAPPEAADSPRACGLNERRHYMTTSGYNPTAMPGPETRYIPRIPDFTPRSTDGIVTDGSTAEGD